MNRRSVLVALGGALSVGLAGCGAVGGDGGDYDIGMGDSAFEPEEFTASVGDTVVWKNTSGRAHTVTAYDDGIPEDAAYFASGGFDSEAAARQGWKDGDGGIYSGKTYEHTFETPGTYEYLCIPHVRAGMTGTVVVEE